MASELEELGKPADQVAEWRDRAGATLASEADEEDEFEVWPENAETVAVFKHCQWSMVGVGMAGAHYVGIEGPEIQSVMDAFEIPASRRMQVLTGVRFMVSAALPLLNREK